MASPLIAISRKLASTVERLDFGVPTKFVYNPLVYARKAHEAYLERHGAGPKGRVLLVGMNPGPFGMAQTGVPFGDVKMVREFLGIEAPIEHPKQEHPARPVSGFACKRSEVSGTRLWGWARDRHGSAEVFFRHFFVMNYCPLVFMEESGRNRTPDKLPASEQAPLFAACDQALAATVAALEPSLVVGVGAFAQSSALRALPKSAVRVGCILHPSPANPKANSGWGRIVEEQLRELGVTSS
jgi:single-strand selective monofunctional uracil DNA glycosylase